MNRRVTAAIIAAVLALGAFVSIFIYVRSADVRALNGVAAKSVYTVVKPIVKGTLAENLGDSIQLTQVPAKTVPDNAVIDLSQIQKKVASVDLVAGEILLTTRFLDPTQISVDEVPVPKGMEQISVLLAADKVRGGVIKAGDVVGVVFTMKMTGGQPYTIPGIGTVTPDGDNITKQIMHKVLVTRVQGGITVTPDEKSGGGAPASSVMITLALSVSDVEKLTWAQSTGTILLAVENPDTDDSQSQYTIGKTVMK